MRNLSLKFKLLMVTLILCAVSIVIGITSYISLRSVSAEYGWIVTKLMPKNENIDQMYLNYRKIRINLRTLGLPNLPPAQAEANIAGVHDALADYDKADQKYKDLGFIPGQQEMYDQLNKAWIDFKKTGEEVLRYQKRGTPEDKEKC